MFQAQRRVRNTLPRAKRQLEAVQDGGGDRQALSQGNGFSLPAPCLLRDRRVNLCHAKERELWEHRFNSPLKLDLGPWAVGELLQIGRAHV